MTKHCDASESYITVQTSSAAEKSGREKFAKLFSSGGGIPDGERLGNLGLYLSRQSLSRILFMNELYSRILSVHGVVMEFGVRWGQNLALFKNFRSCCGVTRSDDGALRQLSGCRETRRNRRRG